MDDHATVAQAELRAIRDAVGVAVGGRGDTDVISDSRVALDAIVAVDHRNATAREIYKDIRQANEGGKRIRLWWAKAHAGVDGNRRADEAAGAALEGEITVTGPKAKSVARAARRINLANEWQRRWDVGDTGRLLHKVIGAVNIQIGSLSRDAIHLLTGHGRVAAYYERFRLREGNGDCECGEGRETADHVLWSCKAADRVEARSRLREAALRLDAGWPLCISRDTKPEIWGEINEFAGRVFREGIGE